MVDFQEQQVDIKADSKEQPFKIIEATNQFEQEMTMIQKATLIVDSVTDMLYEEINKGSLFIDDQVKQFSIQRKKQFLTRNQSLMSKLQEVNLEEHRLKVKNLMQANKKMRQKRNKIVKEFQNSLKKQNQEQNRIKQEEKQKQIQRRRSLIEERMLSKSQIMMKIRQFSIQSNQRFKNVKNKKFLHQQKEEEFKLNFLLPKIQEEKKILERRKNRMKSIDVNELIEHQKNYYVKKEEYKINRSMTSRIVKSQNFYSPPEYVPKSYLLYEAEQLIKKQQQLLKLKEAQINKEKVKAFAKQVSQIHKLQKQLSRSRQIFPSPSPQTKQQTHKKIEQQKQIKIKSKRKQLSKQQTTNVGNEYFKALLEEIKKAKLIRSHQQKLKQKKLKKLKQQQKLKQEQDLQIQIRSEVIRTVQKVQKIERNYKIRSKKIQSIFNDTTIDPLLKYEKLKHQVQNMDKGLRLKNTQSEDIKQRTQATGCYLNAIKAKIKLLQISNNK